MKKVLIVGGFFADKQENEALKELQIYLEATLVDCAVQSAFFDDLFYTIDTDSIDGFISNGVSLKSFDTIFIRGPKMRMRSDHAYYLSRFCVVNGIELINDYSLYYPGTKVAQMMLFFEAKVSFLKTIYSKSNENLLKNAEEVFGYPYILKTITGSHGDANFLIKNNYEAMSAIKDYPTVDFLAQEFCENDRDYRVLVTPHKVLTFARKGSKDTHLNNTSKGADASLAQPDEIPLFIIEQSRMLADKLNLKLAGVDVMPSLVSNEFHFLEINSQPQFRTGALLDEKKNVIRALFGLSENQSDS